MNSATQTILTQSRKHAAILELQRICNDLGSKADPCIIKALVILDDKRPATNPTTQAVVRNLYNILRKYRKQYAKDIQSGTIHIQLAQRRLGAQKDAIDFISGSYDQASDSIHQTKLF